MFEIDLLKGSGRPAKPKPLRVTLWALLYAALGLWAAWMGTHYITTGERLNALQQTLNERKRQQLENLGDVVTFVSGIETQQAALVPRVTELAKILPWQIQWSPILEDISQSVPRGLTLSDFMAQQVKERVPNNKATIHYSMLIGVVTVSDPYLVQTFMDSLRAATWTPNFKKEVRIATQSHREIQDQIYLYFAIECILTPIEPQGLEQ